MTNISQWLLRIELDRQSMTDTHYLLNKYENKFLKISLIFLMLSLMTILLTKLFHLYVQLIKHHQQLKITKLKREWMMMTTIHFFVIQNL